MKLEIKGLKTWSTHDGGGYQCTVYVGGKKAFFVHNDGNGGTVDFHGLGDPKLLEAFGDYVEALPSEHWNDEYGNLFEAEPGEKPRNPKHDRRSKMEIEFGRILDEHENRKKFTRMCKTKTVVQLTGDPAGTYRVYAKPLTPEFEAALRKKLGDTLVEIINHRYTEAAK